MRSARIVPVIAVIVGASLLASEPGAGADGAGKRHLIYLHGRIVQAEQSARPEHPRFGHYELEAILQAFRDRGFAVTGEIRPRDASVGDAADRVVVRVRELLASGVPADHVSVVGASMGAGIALVAAARLQESQVRYALLGACLSPNVRRLAAEEGKPPSGRVLSIREASDELTEPCAAWTEEDGAVPSLKVREIRLETGLAHGFLYRPLREWVDPVVDWVSTAG